ncbi:MAG TPA: SDR family oxidoreductase [Gaiellales bacterium]|jgi:NAD(P)-dependent dehydrogenase (short-subunit alcohol dehydrogenase family)
MSKVVVVTGGSAGVGRAAVRAFADRGYDVAVLARGTEGLEAARREVEAAGGRGLAIPVDVANPEAVEEAAERTEAELGPIDVWVNNAMVTIFARMQDVKPEEFRRATEVTYLGTVWGTMSALRRMRPRDSGTVVQVGSALAYRGIPLQAPYCGAKHAIQGFTDSVRTELLNERSRVHVTMVQMPALNTPQFSWCRSRMGKESQPVPPIFQPEVAAEAIVWSAEHRKRELWVGSPTVKAITANGISALAVDHYLGRKGVDSQLLDEPLAPGRKDNLFEPVPGDHGAHGAFDTRSKAVSRQLEVSLNRRVVGLAVAGGLVALGVLRRG